MLTVKLRNLMLAKIKINFIINLRYISDDKSKMLKHEKKEPRKNNFQKPEEKSIKSHFLSLKNFHVSKIEI